MNLNEEIWAKINATPKLPEEVKKTLHITIMRLIEESKASPVGKKLGVTVMTQEASMRGDPDAPPSSARPKAL